jgi:hypothetical protein
MDQAVMATVVDGFNYEVLEAELRTVIRQKVSEIQSYLRLNTQNAIEIGYRLAEIKGSLPHGQWQQWLTAEFPRSQDTAARWMALAEASQNPQIADFEPSVAYELAAGGDDAIDAAAEIAESRGAVTTKQASELRQSTVSKAPKKSGFEAGQTAYVAIEGHQMQGEPVQVAEVSKNLIRVTLPNNQTVPLLPSELSATPPEATTAAQSPKEKQSTPVDTLRFDLEMAEERIIVLEAKIERQRILFDRVLTGYNATGEIDDALLKEVEMAAIAVS